MFPAKRLGLRKMNSAVEARRDLEREGGLHGEAEAEAHAGEKVADLNPAQDSLQRTPRSSCHHI